MIKCPNCGSTEQVKFIQKRFTHNDWEWVEIYHCGCGCTIDQRVQIREKLTYNKEKIINYEYHH